LSYWFYICRFRAFYCEFCIFLLSCFVSRNILTSLFSCNVFNGMFTSLYVLSYSWHQHFSNRCVYLCVSSRPVVFTVSFSFVLFNYSYGRIYVFPFDAASRPFFSAHFVFLFLVFFIYTLFYFCLVPCGRLSWLTLSAFGRT